MYLLVSPSWVLGANLFQGQSEICIGKHGLLIILVFSGESKREDIQSGKEQPDWIFENVGELLKSLRADRMSG